MGTKLTRPQAIFFDLDETLVANQVPIRSLFASLYSDFSEQLDPEKESLFFEALRVHASRLWASMFESEQAPEIQLASCFADSVLATGEHSKATSEQLGDQIYEQFLAKSSQNVRLHSDALDTLRELSSRGFITGIITNGIEQLQLGKIHQLGLQNEVDHVIVSAQARAHKPNKEVFELALSKPELPPDAAWHVGDHELNDVAGAIRSNMTGIFYDPSRRRRSTAFNDLEIEPDKSISELIEVLELVE